MLTRIVALESHAAQQDQRHQSLENKLDTNFAAVLNRLDSMPLRAARPAEGRTVGTPNPKKAKGPPSQSQSPSKTNLVNLVCLPYAPSMGKYMPFVALPGLGWAAYFLL